MISQYHEYSEKHLNWPFVEDSKSEMKKISSFVEDSKSEMKKISGFRPVQVLLADSRTFTTVNVRGVGCRDIFPRLGWGGGMAWGGVGWGWVWGGVGSSGVLNKRE